MNVSILIFIVILTIFVKKSPAYRHSRRIIFPGDAEYIAFEDSGGNQKRSGSPNLLPSPNKCGPIRPVAKIYGGTEAELGEFPWLANLEYRKHDKGNLTSVCAGNIINQRYVLTAAHCVVGKIEERIGKLVSLRVGDHNTETQIDCVQGECIDPFQRFSIVRKVVHDHFRTDAFNRTINDIALLRTDRDIIYSITVAPICLGDVVKSVGPLKPGIKLVVAGWGHTGTQARSPVKRILEVPYVENGQCSLALNERQLCAGGEFNRDSCTGDSGGGLARLTNQGWVIEGIVSYGGRCGLEKPSVYTRVASYLDWIHANVEP